MKAENGAKAALEQLGVNELQVDATLRERQVARHLDTASQVQALLFCLLHGQLVSDHGGSHAALAHNRRGAQHSRFENGRERQRSSQSGEVFGQLRQAGGEIYCKQQKKSEGRKGRCLKRQAAPADGQTGQRTEHEEDG